MRSAMLNTMRRLLRAVIVGWFALSPLPGLTQMGGSGSIADQQQTLQGLLNNAIVALRNNDAASACQLRSQALNLLMANFNAFTLAYPTNNWSDLQRSLEGSLSKCAAKGL